MRTAVLHRLRGRLPSRRSSLLASSSTRFPVSFPASFSALTVLALCAGCCLPAAAHAEDLLQVYDLARRNDPTLSMARAVQGEQTELARQARAALMPQWSAQYAELRYQADGSREHQLTHSLNQVLLDLGKLRTLDAATTGASAEDARVQAAQADLCARVATAYFGVLSAQAGLATTRAVEDAYRQQVEQSQARFEARLVAAQDVEQARAYYELARVNTAQAQESLADARQALAQITGQIPGELRPLAPELPMAPPEPSDPQAWVDQALRDNPSLRAGALDLTASEQRVAAAGAAHLPTLSVGLDGERRAGTAVSAPDGRYTTTVGLRLNIPLFAGGAVESQKRQAVYQREHQKDDLEASRRSVIRNTQGYYQAVLTSLSQMRTTQAAVVAAEASLASTRSGLDLGARSMTDLLLAIQTHSNARSAWDQARHRHVLAKLLLQQAAGHLGEPQLAAVNLLLLQGP